MATFVQTVDGRTTPATFALAAGISPQPGASQVQAVDELGVATATEEHQDVDNKPAVVVTERASIRDEQSSAGFDWFESFHVVPRAFDFGNLLSDQSAAIEVFSAFRRTKEDWTAFVNGAGVGVELGGEPSLPTEFDPLTGLQMTLDVSAIGDPFVDAVLEFVFGAWGSIFVTIEIQRIVLWGLEPEQPFTQEIAFLTDVQTSKDGTEKRPSVRQYPRQSWPYDYLIEEGTVAQTLENLLFDYQARTFGVPVWFDDARLTSGVSAGATSLPLNATEYRDFRVGGLVVVLVSQSIFDVVEIDTVNPTEIVVASGILNDYDAGAFVFPLAVCRAQPVVSGERFPVGLQRARIRFTSIDNAIDLADLTPFASYNGKLLLDSGNSMIRGNVPHTFTVEIVELDGDVGDVFRETAWPSHKRGHRITIRAEGRQAVWELRGLAHALRGRQVSFYSPRDSDDLEPVANLVSGTNTLDVVNVGYAQFVRNRKPKNVIRVSFVSGATPLLRAVTGSSVPSPTVDRLVLDANWPATFTPDEIARIEYVETIRLDADTVRLEFDASGHTARLVAPVTAVLE